ncbi:glucose-6-phosphate isomerase [Nodularia sphaerocarpa]|uniref:glucose-6-phosphate isomerase n=1 Tax=Nodularia sphaerocarpa TaxID=137816 RepID=UPI001EFAF033|nr:glucose-6-phosphate isomerase [Nodularia sphaerocarpa]MDB9375273.1 glucose-6-phosphate isomerase [Nodularia sphaerocarpa CS-585]MDB9379533.1 glucose-6-phosphate isomerase [Nodularia sphaerocarpa CS-585A2]ULP72626.1 Glucose-6-phosphate isomerase [Nodularia sphaerocarpa UHCC 0038]
MDAKALWQRYQNWLYFHEGLGLYLDVSRMGFDHAFVESLRPKFDKAFADMAELEKGAIANPDEGRMVGHYWLRNPDLAPTPELTQEIVQTLEQIEAFAEKVHTGAIHPPKASRFTDIISIGIGGSALGPEFVAEALAPDFPSLKIHFIDNSDPAGIDRTLNQLRNSLSSTLVLVISKSGGTPEPRNGMIEVKAAYSGQNLDFAKHAVAITSVDSNLDKVAQAEGWLGRFPMYDWVGGRTSELSAVGLVPAVLQGIDIRAMIAGAKEMDDATRVSNLENNPAALLALAWYFSGNGKGEKDMVVLPYKDSLLLFSRYLQQLVMESLGKEKDLDGNTVYQGIAVYGNKGSTDQHAYVQQLREGIPNFFATFIEVLEDREGKSLEVEPGVTSGDFLSGFLLGTRQALYENQRDSITVTIPQVNPKTVGALIALYERAVGLYASLVNVNAYHQPGVEAGKKAAAVILELQSKVMAVLQKEKTALSLEEVAQKAGAAEEVEAIYKILRHLHANGRGVVLQGELGKPGSLKVSVG